MAERSAQQTQQAREELHRVVGYMMFAAASEKAEAMPFALLPAGFSENRLTLASWNRWWRDSRRDKADLKFLASQHCLADGNGPIRITCALRSREQ